ncbi:E2 ubiquitin-conjugating enzyme [Ranunculus cassubicifolius]
MAEERYNLKNPAVKRILQEVKEMQANPSDDFMSLPLEGRSFLGVESGQSTSKRDEKRCFNSELEEYCKSLKLYGLVCPSHTFGLIRNILSVQKKNCYFTHSLTSI